MGTKKKIGKQRKDVFYHRAKEAGYRARAAYKLIQLNKKYNFLSSSRVCVDLCAAPGSWMQVCTKFMPVSSIIIGVDLYPIAHIPNTISIQGDITTEKVRHELKNNLKTWKADLVIHDGAPNVGQNWLFDAYQQNLLVLHSFKLACEFLQKGGTFLTKVFRSKDHLALEYVFRKLFKKVEATKPIASRFASAEIFVVCQGYLCPDKIDPQFFNAKSVFQELDIEPQNKINILKPDGKKRKPVGYEDGATMLFKRTKISEFINTTNFIEVLEKTNEFEWDCEVAKESDYTTADIVECCKDIRVLGRKELRRLITWRKNVRNEIESKKVPDEADDEGKSKDEGESKEETKKTESDEEKDEVDQEFEEIEKIQKEITELKDSQTHAERQKRKRVEKKKKRSQEKVQLRLMVPGDSGPQEQAVTGLFALSTLSKGAAVDDVIDQDADMVVSDEEGDPEAKGRVRISYSKDSPNMFDNTGMFRRHGDDSDDGSEDDESGGDSSDDEGLAFKTRKVDGDFPEEKKQVSFALEDVVKNFDSQNPLTTDLVGDIKLDRRERKAEKFYSNTDFDEVEDETIEDYELESAITDHKAKGGIVLEKKRTSVFLTDDETGYSSDDSDHAVVPSKTNAGLNDEFNVTDCPESESDSDTDTESENEQTQENQRVGKKGKKAARLNPVGLALATKMIHSRKAKRDIMDAAWNRHMYGEEDLPEFFAEDEKRFNSPVIRVDRADLKMYQERAKDVNVKTIKKAVEAKARKQRRVKKSLAKSRKKAETITNNTEMSSREKSVELKKIYKKATNAMKPKDKKYVVMKKSFGGKKPKGGKGPSKMVDARLKKDKRATAVHAKKGKKGRKR